MNKKQTIVYNILKTIHPIAAEAYARLMIELAHKRRIYFTPVVAHCAREILNILTRPLKTINSRDDILCFLHTNALGFDSEELRNKEQEKNDKCDFLSAKGRYTLFFLKYYSPKLSYIEACQKAKEIKDYNFEKYAHSDSNISEEETRKCVKNICRFTEYLTGIREQSATDITDEIDMFISNSDEKLLKRILQQIKFDSFLKNYFYEKLVESTDSNRYLSLLKKMKIFNEIPIYGVPSENTYINYPWLEGEYLYSILEQENQYVKEVLSFLENLSPCDGENKPNICFVETCLKILLKLSKYDLDFSVKNLTNLFNFMDKVYLGEQKQALLDLTKTAIQQKKIDLITQMWKSLCKINWTYSEYNYTNYKTYSFRHSTAINEYEYEQLITDALNQMVPNDIPLFLKILLDVLFNCNLKWPKEIQNDFKRRMIYRPTIEDHEQTCVSDDLIDKLFISVRDIALTLPIEHVEVELEKYREWNIINRLRIYLVTQNGNSILIKKHLLNKQNLQSTFCYHEYYWLLHDNFRKLNMADQSKIYNMIQNYANSFEEEFRKHILVNRLAIIKKDLDKKHKNIYKKLEKEGITARTEYPDFLTYSFTDNFKNNDKTSSNIPTSLNDLMQLIISNPENNTEEDAGFANPDISKLLKTYIQKHYTEVLDNLPLLTQIKEIYYYDLFDALSMIHDVSLPQQLNKILDYIEILLNKNISSEQTSKTCGAIANFFRSFFSKKNFENLPEKEAIGRIQKILLKIAHNPKLSTNKYFDEYKNNPTDTLNRAINDPVGIAFECMILICLYAKENKIKYDLQNFEQMLSIALEKTYLGFICRSLVGLYLKGLYKNYRNWCLRHKDQLFNSEDSFFLSCIFGLMNYEKASKSLYNYLEIYLKRLLDMKLSDIPTSRYGYYLLFYYLNDKLLLNSRGEKLCMALVLKKQHIRTNILAQIYNIFSGDPNLDPKQIRKIKKLLDYCTVNKLFSDKDSLYHYDVLYKSNLFDTKWFIKRYVYWSKYDNFYRKSSWFWEKLQTDYNPLFYSDYVTILKNLFEKQAILDFNTDNFEKLYNFISMLVKNQTDNSNIRKLKKVLDILIKKVSTKDQLDKLRVLFQSF